MKKRENDEIYITLGKGYNGELPVSVYMGEKNNQENVNNFFKLLHNNRKYREEFLSNFLRCSIADEDEMPEDKTVYRNDDNSVYVDRKNKKVEFIFIPDEPKIWADDKSKLNIEPKINSNQLEFNFN